MEIIALLLLIMVGPAAVFFAIGAYVRKKGNRNAAKVLFILAGVYLLISFGTCGFLLASFG